MGSWAKPPGFHVDSQSGKEKEEKKKTANQDSHVNTWETSEPRTRTR